MDAGENCESVGGSVVSSVGGVGMSSHPENERGMDVGAIALEDWSVQEDVRWDIGEVRDMWDGRSNTVRRGRRRFGVLRREEAEDVRPYLGGRANGRSSSGSRGQRVRIRLKRRSSAGPCGEDSEGQLGKGQQRHRGAPRGTMSIGGARLGLWGEVG